MFKLAFCLGLILVASGAEAQNIYPPVIPQNSTNLLPLNNTWTGLNTFSGGITVTIPSLITTNTIGSISAPGSVGQGPLYSLITRSGGYGQYGNWLSNYLVTAATPATQFDTGITSWLSDTNLTGGAGFGAWVGTNTPGGYMSEIYTGGAAIGMEINSGNRWADFGFLSDIGATRYTVGLQIVPDVLPASDGTDTFPVTISVASPAVATLSQPHFYAANQGVIFGGIGLPTGVVAGQTYFVISAGLATNSFEFSATIGGAAVNTTGTSTAPLTVLPSYPGSFGLVESASTHGHQWQTGILQRYDSIAAGGVGINAFGGSVTTDNPAAWTELHGYWKTGIDFTGGSYDSTYAIKLNDLQAISFSGGASIYGNGGTITLTGGISSGASVGVSCSGTPTSSFASVNGIVTHC